MNWVIDKLNLSGAELCVELTIVHERKLLLGITGGGGGGCTGVTTTSSMLFAVMHHSNTEMFAKKLLQQLVFTTVQNRQQKQIWKDRWMVYKCKKKLFVVWE
jgi:hypothetical protein